MFCMVSCWYDGLICPGVNDWIIDWNVAEYPNACSEVGCNGLPKLNGGKLTPNKPLGVKFTKGSKPGGLVECEKSFSRKKNDEAIDDS